MRIQPISIEEIKVPEKRRTLDSAKVDELAESIRVIGLRTPISVRRVNDEIRLVAGAYRLRAAKRLGRKTIDAIFVGKKRTARLWSIAENLHRAELTVLERAQQIEKWRRHLHKDQGGQVARPGGRQPADESITKTAESLNCSRDKVRRAMAIAGLAAKVQEAATKLGLADNQAALLAAARENGTKAQGAKLIEIAERKKTKEYLDPRASARSDDESVEIPAILDRRPLSPVDEDHLRQLTSEFATSKMREIWSYASAIVRERFIAHLRTLVIQP
jgi:ParB-like chromosome segregation protein Spo0J